MRFTGLSSSNTKAFAFSLVGGHNACVSHACLHLLGRLFAVFCIVLQCMRFTRVSASVNTAFAFFFVSRLQCMRFTRVSASVKTTFAFFFI